MYHLPDEISWYFYVVLLGVAEAKCILVTAICVSVCLSVLHRIPTLLHGPGCKLGEY